VPNNIDRYREKTARKAEYSDSVIYSLKDLASKYPPKIEEAQAPGTDEIQAPRIEETQTPKIDDAPKRLRAIELKNEIVRKFDKGEDVAKIAHDFGISQDQIVMILKLAGRK
jgi:hypothetical protein